MEVDATARLRFEIVRTLAGRYGHRVHACLLRERGMSVVEIAKYFGERPNTISRWVRNFKAYGRAGLQEQLGRPPGLNPVQYSDICWTIISPPRRKGFSENRWTASMVGDLIKREYDLRLRKGQCNRILTDANHLRGICVPAA
jgi:transposase